MNYREIKLNLASGNDYREGYINVDDGSMFDSKRDITADIFTYDREPESVDEILVSHFMMYVRPDEIHELLTRWRSWLKEGGSLIIETSDFTKILEEALGGSIERGYLNIFGTKATEPHRWGWTKEALTAKLKGAGFENITEAQGEKKPQRDYKLIATK